MLFSSRQCSIFDWFELVVKGEEEEDQASIIVNNCSLLFSGPLRSDHNPADVLTRGTPPEKLKTWSEGPPFLKHPEPEWPKFQQNPKESGKELSEEMKPHNKFQAANTHEQVDYSATSTESNDVH